MNSVKDSCSPCVLVAQWIERLPGAQEILMGWIPVGDHDFLSHVHVVLINSPFTVNMCI